MSTHVYVVFSQVDYDGTTPVRGFEYYTDAEAFKETLDAHLAARPTLDTNLEGAEWEAEVAKQDAWLATSPIGDKCSICTDSHYIQAIEIFPKQPPSMAGEGKQA